MRRWLLVPCLILTTLTGLGCSNASEQATAPIELTIWGVFDSESNYEAVINDYRAMHPNVSVSFRSFRPEEYQDQLVRSLAEGKGPDIFLMHNDWMRAYQSLMLPLPASVTIGYQEERGTIKKEVVNTLKTEPTISMKAFKDKFVDVVQADAVLPYQPDPKKAAVDKIYGLPVSVDTMALYWNRDLLNSAGIAEAPATWEQMHEAVAKLTKLDAQGKITQSGAAIGTADNVERSADLLALLMMQNGSEMTDSQGRATFDESTSSNTLSPGVGAAIFYTDFANPTKKAYTWDTEQGGSFDAFANGTSAMMFGYSYHLPLIRVAAPKLNFGIAPMPQISDESSARQVNFGNYWLYTVSKDSKNWNWAWDFIEFLTTKDAEALKYLTAANRPPALRSLIDDQIEDEDLSVFAGQVLTAKTWYRGKDVAAAEAALRELITSVLAGADPADALELAGQKVNQTL